MAVLNTIIQGTVSRIFFIYDLDQIFCYLENTFLENFPFLAKH